MCPLFSSQTSCTPYLYPPFPELNIEGTQMRGSTYQVMIFFPGEVRVCSRLECLHPVPVGKVFSRAQGTSTELSREA